MNLPAAFVLHSGWLHGVGHGAAGSAGSGGQVPWNFVVITVGAVVSAGVYAWFWRRRRDVNRFGLLWFALGMGSLVVVALPPVDAAVDRSFAAHMGQHLILWVVAPVLLIAAHPVRTAAAGGLELHSGPAVALLRRHQPQHLMFAWTAIVVAMYGTHLTPLYDVALQNQFVHELEHVVYLLTSLLFWSALLGFGRSQTGGRAVLALAVAAPMVFLGMIITTTDSVLYPTYLQEMGFLPALDDQRDGGAIMWIGSMAAVAPSLLWLVWKWASNEHQRQVLLEESEQQALHDAARR